MTTNGAFDAGTNPGDVVIYNNAALKSDTSAHNGWFRLIYGTNTNKVSIDADNQGSVFGGSVSNSATEVLLAFESYRATAATVLASAEWRPSNQRELRQLDASGNVTDAGAPCGGAGGVTRSTLTIGSQTVTATTCTSATTFTFTGASTSMGAWWSQTGDISALTGYGSVNGIVIDVWVSASNQGSYKLCNVTSGSITTSSIVARMNAQ